MGLAWEQPRQADNETGSHCLFKNWLWQLALKTTENIALTNSDAWQKQLKKGSDEAERMNQNCNNYNERYEQCQEFWSWDLSLRNKA